MAFTLKDRVKDTTTSTGTGSVTLSGTAPSGFQAFSAIGNGNFCAYTIAGGGQWETGIGTYSSSGPTLSRDTVWDSSNSGSPVSFSAGTKDVFVTLPAKLLGWQQIATSTPTGTGSVTFSSIPAIYSDLRLVFMGLSHNDATSRVFTLALSADGTTFSSALNISAPQAAAATLYGSIEIPGYRLDAGALGGFTANLTSSPATATGSTINQAWRCTGGILALRVGVTTGNFDAGTITLYGRL